MRNNQNISALTGIKSLPTKPRKIQTARDLSKTNAPQYPGEQSGASLEQVREYVKNQKRVKGYRITADTGNTTQQVRLSGDARMLLGFSILLVPAQVTADTIPETFTMTINNETVINQCSPKFFSPDFCDDEYYEFPRPLSGTDDITLYISNSNAAQAVNIIFYYI
jgi:hypothetical protein